MFFSSSLRHLNRKFIPSYLKINRRIRKSLVSQKRNLINKYLNLCRKIEDLKFEGQCDIAQASDTLRRWDYEERIERLKNSKSNLEIIFSINKIKKYSSRRYI